MQLTARQSEVLALIGWFKTAYQRPPTRAEIAQHFGWASPNAAEDHLKALAKKGAITLQAGKARGIVIPEPAHGWGAP